MADTQIAERRVKGDVPIGGIIPHYDFNGLLVPDGSYAYCDGSVVSDAESPINGQTLPDLSNRYLVGFGTEGGGDIDTASWNTSPVGNASHQINLQHSHDVNIGSFNITGGSHLHSIGEKAIGSVNTSTEELRFDSNVSFAVPSGNVQVTSPNISTTVTSSETLAITAELGNTSTSSSHTHSVDPPNTTSTNALSTSQSIQPRSIRVRYIMRIK